MSQDTTPQTPTIHIIRRVLRIPAFLGAGLVAMIVGHAAWTLNTPLPATLDGPATVDILPGSFLKNLQRLHREGHVQHPLYLRAYLKLTQQASDIRAGRYTLQQGTTPLKMIDIFARGGKHSQVRLTIPEGWTLFHIADRIQDYQLAERSAFIQHATDPKLLQTLKIPSSSSAEGYLFPDTYLLRPGQSPKILLKRMVQRHREVWNQERASLSKNEWNTLTKGLNIGSSDIITLASIIEREAATDAERPIISRVLYNRLRKGMKLQVDPTCIYGPKRYRQKPSPTLCKDPRNTHSTYVHKGLPPTPIANPGRASIHAALHPTQDTEKKAYLYFVADPARRGEHTFSNTYKEHIKAVKALREASTTP